MYALPEVLVGQANGRARFYRRVAFDGGLDLHLRPVDPSLDHHLIARVERGLHLEAHSTDASAAKRLVKGRVKNRAKD